MGIAQGPAQGNIHRTVAQENGTVVAASGYAVLDWDAIFACQVYETGDVVTGRDIGIVDGTNDKTSAEYCVGKTLGFQGRIGTDERVYGEDVLWNAPFPGRILGEKGSALKAQFLFSGPNEGDIAAMKIGT